MGIFKGLAFWLEWTSNRGAGYLAIPFLAEIGNKINKDKAKWDKWCEYSPGKVFWEFKGRNSFLQVCAE